MIFTAVVSAWFSCKSADSAGAGATARVDTIPLVVLQTAGCFGFCPVYTVTVYPDGRAQYFGAQNVALAGEAVFQLTPEELRTLKASVEAANLWQYPDRLPSQVADAPFNTLRVFRADGAVKSVTGSIDRPQALLDLEKQIKDMGKAHGLELVQGVNPNDPSRANRREVVVLLKDDLNAGNWIGQLNDLKVQLVRRLGEPNQWVLAYDAGQIDEARLLERLKGTPGVITAESYVPTNNRRKE
ncbi:MAG: DUF6438 domain-containing protein [Saprospiraceae bacterium]|nr:DUF6438 domain-containing protein [Saprospiraceae bacterium]